MNSKQRIQAISLTLLLFIAGCGKDGNKNRGTEDHILRPQVDTMRDAQSLTNTLNRQTAERDRQAAELTGHP